jgi:hypothetical protein
MSRKVAADGCQWLMPVILTTGWGRVAEIRRIMVQSQLRKKANTKKG